MWCWRQILCRVSSLPSPTTSRISTTGKHASSSPSSSSSSCRPSSLPDPCTCCDASVVSEDGGACPWDPRSPTVSEPASLLLLRLPVAFLDDDDHLPGGVAHDLLPESNDSGRALVRVLTLGEGLVLVLALKLELELELEFPPSSPTPPSPPPPPPLPGPSSSSSSSGLWLRSSSWPSGKGVAACRAKPVKRVKLRWSCCCELPSWMRNSQRLKPCLS